MSLIICTVSSFSDLGMLNYDREEMAQGSIELVSQEEKLGKTSTDGVNTS